MHDSLTGRTIMNRRNFLAAAGAGVMSVAGRAASDDKPKAQPPGGAVRITVAELAELLTRADVNPSQLYGLQIELTGKIVSINKGVDGGTVPYIEIEGWPKDKDIYGTAFVHNVIPDHIGKVGERKKIHGLIVQHGFGTLTLWCYRWVAA
jgi:hypothetical protein